MKAHATTVDIYFAFELGKWIRKKIAESNSLTRIYMSLRT